MPTIAVSDFVKRQTIQSPFSYFEGAWSTVVDRTRDNFDRAVPGYREGVLLVPVPPEGFFSGTVLLHGGEILSGKYEPRRPGEAPRMQIGVVGGQKIPAVRVMIVLYGKNTLMEGKENTIGSCPGCLGEIRSYPHDPYSDKPCVTCGGDGFADWEIISVNAAPDTEDEPMPANTLLHNHFHVEGSNDGGTSTGMSDAEFVMALGKSFLYWKNKAQVAG